jgi:hypothetical protein
LIDQRVDSALADVKRGVSAEDGTYARRAALRVPRGHPRYAEAQSMLKREERRSSTSGASGECYHRAAGNIDVGKTLYYDYGAGYQPSGTVIALGTEDGERVLYLQYSDGGRGSLRRDAIITDEKWMVRC